MGFSSEHHAGISPCMDDKADEAANLAGRRETDPKVRIELSSSHVRALMEAGRLRVEGLRCLDTDTKKIIRHLCLECCLGSGCGGMAVFGVHPFDHDSPNPDPRGCGVMASRDEASDIPEQQAAQCSPGPACG